MELPQITWYAKLTSEENFKQTDLVYAGAITPNNYLTVDIQLWNNRWGESDVETLSDFNILMYFQDVEDSALLENCSIFYNGAEVDIEIENKKALVKFAKAPILSGKANDGSSLNEDNSGNFISLQFIFTTSSQRLKENDLKHLILEIVPI